MHTTCAKEEVISYFMLVAKKLLPMNKDEKSVALIQLSNIK